jgi:pimeloyl-ACP methyl ester carboxylesterase
VPIASKAGTLTSIVLVHGAWHGPWCWDDFAHRLTERGHHVHAVGLRGHDKAPGRIWHRVGGYVEDLRAAVSTMPQPVVVVGHSLGGLVVQRFLERNDVAGAVLMASIPTGGTIRAVGRIAVRHPLRLLWVNLTLSLFPMVRTPALAREYFFTPDTPQETVDRCLERLQDESYPAFLDTIFRTPRPARVRTPMLVLGAERDSLFTVAEVRRTAAAYRTDAEIISGIGHDMMLDERWQLVADRIDAWIRERS